MELALSTRICSRTNILIKSKSIDFYNNFLKVMAERRLWTQFEDNALRYLRQECQIAKWSEIAIKMVQIFNITDRNQKQCRDRYTNSLNPNLNLNDWNQNDQLTLIDCHKKYGNKWTIIAQRFKGRTDSFIKNHFYSRLRKCIRKLNRFIDEEFKKKYKKLNLNIIFKLTNLVEDKLTKITQDVREFYEKLMYNLIDFSLKAEEGIRDYDPEQIQTFILALTSLENLSGTIGANRKPKRGRGHKRQERYLISVDGLCLVLLEDQLILQKDCSIELRPMISITSENQNQDNPHSEKEVICIQKEESEKLKPGLKNQPEIPCLFAGKNAFDQKKFSLETNASIAEQGIEEFKNQISKQTQEHLLEGGFEKKPLQCLQNHHQDHSDIMDYIMENSFDYNENFISLSKQASFQVDNLF